MKVRLIQAVVVGLFVMVGIVVSETEMFSKFRNVTCDSLTIEGKDATINMRNGRIQFRNAKTDEVGGYIMFDNHDEGLTGVLISCRAVMVTKATHHYDESVSDDEIVIEGDRIAIKEKGTIRSILSDNLIALYGERGLGESNISASLVVSEDSGFVILGDKFQDNVIHARGGEQIVREREY